MTDRVPVRESRILASPNKLKLATFGLASQGGTTITKAPGLVDTDWAQQVRIAHLSEAAGIEAILPGARWSGYGGETDFQGRSFETFAWAGGIAAITKHAQIFSTFHVPTAHPVRVAKTIATLDHISGGRFGLNIVAGWNAKEIEMFGGNQRDHDERYEYADEFFDAVDAMLDREGYFDIVGKRISIPGAFSEPKPIQSPRPVYMAAGMSPRGRRFAAEHADISFMPPTDISGVGAIIADTKRMAEEHGREVKTFGQAQIVCADTEKEARDYVAWYVDELGDFEGARNIVGSLFANTISRTGEANAPIDENNPRLKHILRAMISGHGGRMLVGTPEQVVDGLIEISDAGYDGTTVSWLNYEDGLAQFSEQILPLMISAGLRVDEPDLKG